MDPFDKIIGYDAVKSELIRMADVLAHPEIYSALGVSVPRGLLLHGEPGVGKTLMVNSLIKASGLPSFTCRSILIVFGIKALYGIAVLGFMGYIVAVLISSFQKKKPRSFDNASPLRGSAVCWIIVLS